MMTLQPSYLGASNGAPVANFDHDGLPPANEAFGKLIRRQKNKEMFEPATVIGLGAVAVWLHVRYPRLRPRSLMRAIAHVAVSFVGLMVLPMAVGALLPLLSSESSQLYTAVALLIVTLTYVLTSWVWLLARILHDFSGGNPRGGRSRTARKPAGICVKLPEQAH